MAENFVAKVRSQPWYAQARSVFDAAKVPEYLWIGTIKAEHPGAVGDSAEMNRPVPDSPGFSYGMFQLHNNPNGTDPIYSSQWAAKRMGTALAQLGPNYTPRQALSAIEIAAWPGNDPSLIAGQDAGRAAALNSVIEDAKKLNADPDPKDNPLQKWIYENTPIGKTEKVINNPAAAAGEAISQNVGLQKTLLDLGKQAFIGGIIVAVLAGGFALLSSGGSNGRSA